MGDWAWCHTFYIIYSTSTFIFCSSLAKVKVVKQKGNVNFLEDCKSENQKKEVFNHPPFPLSKWRHWLSDSPASTEKDNKQNLTHFSKRFAVTGLVLNVARQLWIAFANVRVRWDIWYYLILFKTHFDFNNNFYHTKVSYFLESCSAVWVY